MIARWAITGSTALILACSNTVAEPQNPPDSTIGSSGTEQTTTSTLTRSMLVTHQTSGRTVEITVTPVGFAIEFDRLDDTGRTAHIHVFVDRGPPSPGDVVPLGDPSIIHSVIDTLSVELDPGPHVLWVIAADGPDNALIPPEPVRIDLTID